LYNSDSKAGKQDKEKSGRKPRHSHGAKSQYCATKRAVFMESCFSPLSALGSKICVHFQNKIPFQQTKTLKTVGCTLQQKRILVFTVKELERKADQGASFM
jgi:hypothetical protein